jgi:hypothetical protein
MEPNQPIAPQDQPDNAEANSPITAADLADAIAELQAYRDRLFEETTTAAKKAKLSKAATMAKLEPELEPIDAMLQGLQIQLDAMIAEERSLNR